MKREAQRDLEILSTIAQGGLLTQRSLAEKLGIALGLTNLYLNRLARKGYIKLTTIPPHRIKYYLTPRGFTEKTRLTYQYMDDSLRLYRETRKALREALTPLARHGHRRVVLYGTGEAAELAYLTLRELRLDLTEVVDENGRGGTFLGLPIRPLSGLPTEGVDVVIVAAFTPADEVVQALIGRGVPREKIVSLTGA